MVFRVVCPVAGSKQGHNDQGKQRQTVPGIVGLLACFAFLQGSCSARAERSVVDDNLQRGHPLGANRTGDLEGSSQAIHAPGCISGEFYSTVAFVPI